MEILRKLNTDQKVNWVEGLPRVLRIIHDTPGKAGLAPYVIVLAEKYFWPVFLITPHGFVRMLRIVLSAWTIWTTSQQVSKCKNCRC